MFTAATILACSAGAAHAQTFNVLHSFGGTLPNKVTDGSDSVSNMIFDGSGNLFGTSEDGGANNQGMLWEITSEGVYLDLHDFDAPTITYPSGKTGPDGRLAEGTLIWDSGNDSVYGTCEAGAGNGYGCIWAYNLKTDTYSDVYDFGASAGDGQNPVSGVTLSPSGFLYGTCTNGGAYYGGTIWKFAPASKAYANLHSFGGKLKNSNGLTGDDGEDPESAVAIDSSGNVFGTTEVGGATEGQGTGGGMLYELSASGSYYDLYDFGLNQITYSNGTKGLDGKNPFSTVCVDASGNLYGTLSSGGAYAATGAGGMLWEVSGVNHTTGAGGVYHDLQDFGGGVATNGNPRQGVTIDPNGNLFGCDASNVVLWEYTPATSTAAAVYKVVHTFNSSTDGTYTSQPTVDAYGNLYGVTQYGGANSGGVAWVEVLGKLTGVSVNPSTVIGQNATTGTVTISVAAPAGGLVVNLGSSGGTVAEPTNTTVTIPAGKTSATFPISTQVASSATTMSITATLAGVTMSASITVEPLLQSVTFSPATVVSGQSSQCTITLGGAQTTDTVLQLIPFEDLFLTSNTVTIKAGATSVTFPVSTGPRSSSVTTNLDVSQTGTALGGEGYLNIIGVQSLALAPTSVASGASSTGTVTLSSAAPSGGISAPIFSNTTSAVVPATCAIAAGATKGTFTITTKSVSAATTAIISAGGAAGSGGAQVNLTIQPPTLSFVLIPSIAVGGTETLGTVGFTAPVASATTVTLTSSKPFNPFVYSTVTVPGGASSVTFPIHTYAVSFADSATISATLGSTTVTSQPMALSDIATLTFSPTSVVGGSSTQAYAALIQPLNFAWTGTASLSSTVASLPVTGLLFNPGAPGAGFTINTVPVAVNTNVSVFATLYEGNQLLETFTVLAPTIKSFTISPTSVQGSSSTTVTGTITLSSTPPKNFAIALQSSNTSAATVPGSVAVSGTTVTFKITHAAVSANTAVTLTATLNGTKTTAKLTVTP